MPPDRDRIRRELVLSVDDTDRDGACAGATTFHFARSAHEAIASTGEQQDRCSVFGEL